MTGQPRFLTFAWWNLHNFAHYDPARTSAAASWPKKRADYEAKRDRVLTAFQEVFPETMPDLLAVCEITREAARDFTHKLPGGYDVAVAAPYPRDDDFQVAVLYRSGLGFTPEPPLMPSEEEDVTEGTRPMIPVHFTSPGSTIRFVACHWTAFEATTSEVARQRLADVLRRDTHAFLEPEVPTPGKSHHVVVLGDLNEEPMSKLFDTRLIGRRDRESSRTRHWSDKQARRVRLYNAAWRFLGERVPHVVSGPPTTGAAGTWFKAPHEWRTFDHVLVSSGLLGTNPPYLDEAQTKVVPTPIMVDEDGLPRPFEPGRARGVSDHLPIVGRLVLAEAST